MTGVVAKTLPELNCHMAPIVVVPTPTALAIPDEAPIVATAGALLDQVDGATLEVPSEYVAVATNCCVAP